MKMRSCWPVAAMVLLFAMVSVPAHACKRHVQLSLDDVAHADVVVIGRIVNYRLVPHEAHFVVKVDEVLLGKAGKSLAVRWDNSTFAEPQTMPAGPLLIALTGLGPKKARDLNAADPSFTVLQGACSDPFIFETKSAEAIAVRERLNTAIQKER